MKQNSLDINQDLRKTTDLFLSKWKLILFFVILMLGLSYIYLKYSTYEYQASASIKIKNDDQNNSQLKELSQLQNYGLFSSDFNNITDEVEIIKSRRIIKRVVDDLDLNIKYYVQGRIKEQEVYSNPPIVLNFFASDSIINKIDTTLYLNIKSQTKFSLSGTGGNEFLDIEDENAVEYDFGDKITTGFGGLIITPNIDEKAQKIGRTVKVVIKPVDFVVEIYQSKINVISNEGSDILKLTVKHNLKDKASLILNELIKKYNEDVVSDKQLIVKATSDFINNRLDVVSNELEQVDFTAESLQKSNRLTALATQSNIYLQSEKENEAKIITTSNQIQMVDYMKDHLAKNNSNSDLLPADIGIADNSVSQITKSHNELVLERNRILKGSSEKNPTVINLNSQIEALKANLEQSLDNMKSTSQITLNTLNREDARIRSQIYSAPTKERQFRDATRQQNIKESLYLYLLQKREETAISLGMSSPNAKIIDAAYTSTIPVTPKPKFVYLTGLILGLIIPVGFIYLKDILDTKVHDKADLQEVLDIPFIGDIPRSDKRKQIISKVDYSPKAEAFRMIRTNIDFMLKANDPSSAKTLFVTSTIAQEGKSHTSTNLATSLSYSEKKVLLIETDIRVPKVEDYLKVKSQHGLTDYLSDPELDIQDIKVSPAGNNYLDIIPAGTIPPNPAELLMKDRVSVLFEKVKKQYDYIVVDTAAVGLVTDTLLISHFADMFIYVVSAEKIDKRQLHIAKTMYDEKRLPNMTLLLNGTTKKKGYGYGYGTKPNKKKWYQFGK